MPQTQPAKKPTVGFLLDDSLDRPDGVQQWVLTVGNYLTQSGWRVVYFAGQTKRTDLPRLVSLGRLRSWRFNQNRGQSPTWVASKKLKAAWQSNPVDIIHVQAPYSPFLAHRFINHLPKGVPVVASFHVLPANWLTTAGLRILGHLVSTSRRRIDLFSANSPPTVEFYRRTWGVDSQLIANPVKTKHFTQAQPMSLGANLTGSIKVVFLGRLVPRKGSEVLIEAVGRLPTSLKSKISLHIGGQGPLQDQLQQLTKTWGLEQQTKFWGFIDEADKASFLAAADIVVLPASGGESFGISLVEALASGRPLVLGGDNPGYRSILAPRPELLFDATDPAGLSQRLGQLLNQGISQRQALVDWGLKRAKNYDIDQVIGPQLKTVYRQLLKPKV